VCFVAAGEQSFENFAPLLFKMALSNQSKSAQEENNAKSIFAILRSKIFVVRFQTMVSVFTFGMVRSNARRDGGTNKGFGQHV
jgi:hypothetical protein